MPHTIIRQIAVEINSNYGPGFKSIIFLFILSWPQARLQALALLEVGAGTPFLAPAAPLVMRVWMPSKRYLFPQGCLSTECKYQEQEPLVFGLSISQQHAHRSAASLSTPRTSWVFSSTPRSCALPLALCTSSLLSAGLARRTWLSSP